MEDTESSSLLMSERPVDAVMPAAVKYFLTAVQPALDAFAARNCSKFANVTFSCEQIRDEVVFQPDYKDQNLEHWTLFQQYQGIFESKMESFLASRQVQVVEFVRKCSEGEGARRLGLPAQEGGQFLDLLKLVDDFGGFLLFMWDRYNRSPEGLAALEAACTDTVEGELSDLDLDDESEDAEDGDAATAAAVRRHHRDLMPAAVTYFRRVVQPMLDHWAQENADTFVLEDGKANPFREESEHCLEHHALYQQYVAVFERAMGDFFVDQQLDMTEFMRRCLAAYQSAKDDNADAGDNFLEVVSLMDDFDHFMVYMRFHAATKSN